MRISARIALVNSRPCQTRIRAIRLRGNVGHQNQSSTRSWRSFSTTQPLKAVKPFLLADIGEGIKEVQIIQWFVQPGARVEQFDKLCEVASDKAIVEITSRYDGVIKQLHHQPEEMAQVGKPLCDIDIQQDLRPEDEATVSPLAEPSGTPLTAQQPQKAVEATIGMDTEVAAHETKVQRQASPSASPGNTYLPSLATPAVRGMLKEMKVRIEDVQGTGKDGRVLKEDVLRHVESQTASPSQSSSSSPLDPGGQQETAISLSPVQTAMFKTMTRSLSVPHFLFADEIDLTSLLELRQRLVQKSAPEQVRVSCLSFIVKALSLALNDFPILNARLETGGDTEDKTPRVVLRSQHNIGVAMDTPQGLLVPNIKNVAGLSIHDIATQIARLRESAVAGRLTSSDLTGGTITVSNIGSIGGTYVAPILVPGELAIVGIGRTQDVPSFNEQGVVVKRSVGNFSWSADHRIVDGATLARLGQKVRMFLEDPVLMLAHLK